MSEIEHLVMPALRAAGRPTTYENQGRMRKALMEAAAHAGAEAVGVKVKPLEWEAREERQLGATTKKYWRAQTAFDWGYRVKPYGKGFSFGNAVEYPTVEAAKAAAQADYEARILSALAHPAVPEGWQPIETAPKDGTRFLATGGGLANEIEVASWNDRVGAWNTESYTLEDWENQTEGYSRPAHWMPLPKPPVSAAEKEGGNG